MREEKMIRKFLHFATTYVRARTPTSVYMMLESNIYMYMVVPILDDRSTLEECQACQHSHAMLAARISRWAPKMYTTPKTANY